MKMFKAKKIVKRKRISKLKVLLFTFFFFFSFVFAYLHSREYKLDKNVLYKDITYFKFDFFDALAGVLEKRINEPVNLLNSNVRVTTKNIKKVSKTEENIVKLSVSDKKYNPLIYIYNTHQQEKYVDYSVYEASLELVELLNRKGLDTFFEEQSVTTFLQNNNLSYSKSYSVSRKYLEEAKNKYSNLKYFFDIHRDALTKEKSTININGESYAKVLFVVGKENNNYEQNLINANRLNEIINVKAPGISRGVITKEGNGVNGIYNQDIDSNVFLIEVGGNNNTKEEVLRTLTILNDSIFEYIKGVI